MDTVVTAMTTAFSSIVTSLESALASIAPLAIPLVGIGLVVTIGIGLFKKISNKGTS